MYGIPEFESDDFIMYAEIPQYILRKQRSIFIIKITSGAAVFEQLDKI